MTPWLLGSAVPVAWAVDRWFGEPAARWHPVVWMGRWLDAFGAPWHGERHGAAFAKGAAVWCVGASVCVGLALALMRGLDGLAVPAVWTTAHMPRWMSARTTPWTAASLPPMVSVLGLGLLLKPMLAWRMLHDEVAAVDHALAQGLPEGRAQLARLVSRDTSALDPTLVRESALESLSENLNDSLVAPLFWFAVAGLPGAVLYRFANTADAMWGYRGEWEWAGKWAARADDLLSWLPARLTALFIAASAGRWLRGLRREAGRTPSPNSGWPMAALALALNVRLRKPQAYALNDAGDDVEAAHMAAALRLCSLAAWLAMLLAWAVLATVGWRS